MVAHPPAVEGLRRRVGGGGGGTDVQPGCSSTDDARAHSNGVAASLSAATGGAGPNGIVEAASAGFISLFSASLVAKVITFASTVAIARTLGRAMLGVGTLQLDELLFMGPLVMTRDGLRKVAYRVDSEGVEASQSLVNLCWLTAPVTLGLGLAGARGLSLNRLGGAGSEGASSVEDGGSFARAAALTLLALALAVAHEPAFLLAQSRMDQRFRARSETAAVLAKCAATLGAAIGLKLGLEAFALGNVAYSGCLLVLYIASFQGPRHDGAGASGASLLPRRTPSGSWWADRTFGPAKEFWVQSLQKWVLENGEKVAMVFLGTDEQAGEYALVSNLGSIVARLLFQPLEEMALATFGKLQAIAEGARADDAKRRQARRTMRQALSVLLRLLTLLGLVFAAFGPAYSHLLLQLLYGTSWSRSAAPRVLAWYCTYVLAMAVNGLCEAFVHGVATQEQLRSYNYWMVLFSMAFLFSVVLLVPYGAVGIVVANVLKMVCRIAVCVAAYIRPAFEEEEGGQRALSEALLPAPSVLATFGAAFAVTQASAAFLYRTEASPGGFSWAAAAKHVLVGIACLALSAAVAWHGHGRALARDMRELQGRS